MCINCEKGIENLDAIFDLLLNLKQYLFSLSKKAVQKQLESTLSANPESNMQIIGPNANKVNVNAQLQDNIFLNNSFQEFLLFNVFTFIGKLTIFTTDKMKGDKLKLFLDAFLKGFTRQHIIYNYKSSFSYCFKYFDALSCHSLIKNIFYYIVY